MLSLRFRRSCKVMSRASGCLLVLVGLIAGCSNGNASTIFTGSFNFDDDVQFFTYVSTLTAGPVTVNTTSFSVGGFAPILALYNAMGTFLFSDNGTAHTCGLDGAGSPD